RGAGIITSLVEADGIVRIASTAEGVEPGEEVTVTLLRPISAVRNNILLAGSHDNSLDLLANELKARFPQYTLSTASLGSLGGLLALKEGEAHLAGSHLLDPSTGEYNSSYVERYLPGRELIVMNFLYREQGLMVFPGNPKGIRGIEDLARKDVRFVNRQGGAGTRILLDLKLGEAGISPSQVQGYERVEYTHMAVAMAVRARRADVGLGILAAARALGLDFIPMERERYDLIIPLPFMNLPGVRALLEVMGEKSFKEKVKALGGYDVSRMGEVLSRKGGARA
ncbi:MAG: substrate-binding domain-containing protein, partial [Nitrospinota bacterium]